MGFVLMARNECWPRVVVRPSRQVLLRPWMPPKKQTRAECPPASSCTQVPFGPAAAHCTPSAHRGGPTSLGASVPPSAQRAIRRCSCVTHHLSQWMTSSTGQRLTGPKRLSGYPIGMTAHVRTSVGISMTRLNSSSARRCHEVKQAANVIQKDSTSSTNTDSGRMKKKKKSKFPFKIW